MRPRICPAIVSAAAGLALFCHAGASGAQEFNLLATGENAAVTDEGLHRVDPSIMTAAWVKPDFDLSGYTRVLLMPTAVHFREVPERVYDARSRAAVSEFPLGAERKEWLRELWRDVVNEEFAKEKSYELFEGAGSNVLVVQGFLVDVVSRNPPDSVGSNYTLVRDPWSATVVLELRDGMTAELIARTIDRRHARGLLEAGAVWFQTEDLLERWAEVLSERLAQLSDLGGRPRRMPEWARQPQPPQEQ